MSQVARVAQPNANVAVTGNRPVSGAANVANVSPSAVEEMAAKSAIGSSTTRQQFQDYARGDESGGKRRRVAESRGILFSRTSSMFGALIEAQAEHTTGSESRDPREFPPFGAMLTKGVRTYEKNVRVINGTFSRRGESFSFAL